MNTVWSRNEKVEGGKGERAISLRLTAGDRRRPKLSNDFERESLRDPRDLTEAPKGPWSNFVSAIHAVFVRCKWQVACFAFAPLRLGMSIVTCDTCEDKHKQNHTVCLLR